MQSFLKWFGTSFARQVSGEPALDDVKEQPKLMLASRTLCDEKSTLEEMVDQLNGRKYFLIASLPRRKIKREREHIWSDLERSSYPIYLNRNIALNSLELLSIQDSLSTVAIQVIESQISSLQLFSKKYPSSASKLWKLVFSGCHQRGNGGWRFFKRSLSA